MFPMSIYIILKYWTHLTSRQRQVINSSELLCFGPKLWRAIKNTIVTGDSIFKSNDFKYSSSKVQNIFYEIPLDT